MMITYKKFPHILLLCSIGCLTFVNGCSSKEASDAGNTTQAVADSQQETGDSETSQTDDSVSLGEFTLNDIEGNSYTQDMFADYDLTMVNVFTTWCTPCVNEIPYLETLNNEMADQGVTVVGIILDALDSSGNVDEETIEKAKLLAERTGATYPFLIPDTGYLNGRLAGISAVPETFFVDKEGNIVGETYTGSRSLEEWTEIVEQERSGATL